MTIDQSTNSPMSKHLKIGGTLLFSCILSVASFVLYRNSSIQRTASGQLNQENAVSKLSYELAEFTDRYPHAALGDNFEPTVVVRVLENGERQELIRLKDDEVFETNRILVEDINEDNTPELLITVSHQSKGAANVVYDLNGNELARTDYIGTRFRWRHLIGVMSGENGDKFLIDVVTPHLSATLTVYKLSGQKLIPVFSEDGYPTHTYGSKELDGAYIEKINDQDTLMITNKQGDTVKLVWQKNKLIRKD